MNTRAMLLTTLLALPGCEWIGKKAAETAVETATGGEVDIEGSKVTVKTKEGEATVEGDGQKIVFKGKEGEGTIDTAAGEMHATTKDGTFNMGKEVPKGFPVPMLDGAKVLTGMDMTSPHDGKSYMVSAQIDGKSVADVAQYYQKHFEGDGFKVERIETTIANQSMVVLSAKKDAERIQAGLQVSVPEGQKETVVNITWAQRP